MARLLFLLLSALVFAQSAAAQLLAPPYEALKLQALAVPAEHRTQLPEEDWKWLRSKETLVLGTYPLDMPPFEFASDADEMQGLTADIVALVARELGVGVEVHQFASRKDALLALDLGGIDMLGTVSNVDAPGKIALTSAYVRAKPVLFQRSGRSWGATKEAARHGVVAYNPAYVPAEKVAALFPDSTPRAYASNMAMFSAVAFGEVDLERLGHSTGGDTGLIRLLLGEMLTTSRRDLPGLLTLSTHAEIEAIADLAHRIKGAAKIIKAGPLVEHCEALETACRQESPQDIDEERQALHTYLRQFCNALEHWLNNSANL